VQREIENLGAGSETGEGVGAGSIRGGGFWRALAAQGHRSSWDDRAAFVGYLAAQDGGLCAQ